MGVEEELGERAGSNRRAMITFMSKWFTAKPACLIRDFTRGKNHGTLEYPAGTSKQMGAWEMIQKLEISTPRGLDHLHQYLCTYNITYYVCTYMPLHSSVHIL